MQYEQLEINKLA